MKRILGKWEGPDSINLELARAEGNNEQIVLNIHKIKPWLPFENLVIWMEMGESICPICFSTDKMGWSIEKKGEKKNNWHCASGI
ncbi:hypothetical protein CapIbe_023949 [Capra ibex]